MGNYITPYGLMRRLDPATGREPCHWYIGPDQRYRVIADSKVKKERPLAWRVERKAIRKKREAT